LRVDFRKRNGIPQYVVVLGFIKTTGKRFYKCCLSQRIGILKTKPQQKFQIKSPELTGRPTGQLPSLWLSFSPVFYLLFLGF
jgi:hypothetical protein